MSRARMMFDRQLAGPMRALAVMAIVITAGCAERVEKRPITPAQQQLLTTQRAWLQNRATLFVALGGGLAVETPS